MVKGKMIDRSRSLRGHLVSLPFVVLLFIPAYQSLVATGQTPEGNHSELRANLLRLINQKRVELNVKPLEPDRDLDSIAQRRADQLQRFDSFEQGLVQTQLTQADLPNSGRDVTRFTQRVVMSDRFPESIVAAREDNQPWSFDELLKHEYEKLGIGVSEQAGVPVYTFLAVALREDELIGESAVTGARPDQPASQLALLRNLPEVRRRILNLVNLQREHQHLPPLRLQIELNEVAQEHADKMVAGNFYSHVGPDGDSPQQRARHAGYIGGIGETIASGQLSAEEVVESWLNSPGHRENILNPRFRDLGVGVATRWDRELRRPVPYWVQVLGYKLK